MSIIKYFVVVLLISTSAGAMTQVRPCGEFDPPQMIDGIEVPGFPSCGIGTCYMNCQPMPSADFTQAVSYNRQNAFGGYDCASICRYRDSDPWLYLPGFHVSTSTCLNIWGANTQIVKYLNADMEERNGGDRGCYLLEGPDAGFLFNTLDTNEVIELKE